MSDCNLLSVINQVRENANLKPIEGLSREQNLRTDLGFDSLALAELTVRIEDQAGIDVFANGIVLTIGEIEDILSGSSPRQQEGQ